MKELNEEAIKNHIAIYEYLLQQGEILEQHKLPPEEKIEANRIHNCQSKVYIVMDGEGDRRVLRGEADALIVGGILQMLFTRLNKLTVEECKKEDFSFILDRKDLTTLLSPTRRQGLGALIERIKSLYD